MNTYAIQFFYKGAEAGEPKIVQAKDEADLHAAVVAIREARVPNFFCENWDYYTWKLVDLIKG